MPAYPGPFAYSEAYDKYGNSVRLEENPGKELALIRHSRGAMYAIRASAGTYIATNGVVYSTMRSNCNSYSTPEWINWARRQLQKYNCTTEF